MVAGLGWSFITTDWKGIGSSIGNAFGVGVQKTAQIEAKAGSALAPAVGKAGDVAGKGFGWLGIATSGVSLIEDVFNGGCEKQCANQ